MNRLAYLCLVTVALCVTVGARPNARAQDAAPNATPDNWANQNFKIALDDLLPMEHPDPSYPDHDFITFRYRNQTLIASREYSFALMRRVHEGATRNIFYWLARVRMPEGASISAQLQQLRSQNPQASLAEVERQIKIRTWSFDEKSCPAIAAQAAKFVRLRFTAPFTSNLTLDAPNFEFQVSSWDASMSISLVDDRTFPLVPWAQETRLALARCGAPETAPIKGDQ